MTAPPSLSQAFPQGSSDIWGKLSAYHRSTDSETSEPSSADQKTGQGRGDGEDASSFLTQDSAEYETGFYDSSLDPLIHGQSSTRPQCGVPTPTIVVGVQAHQVPEQRVRSHAFPRNYSDTPVYTSPQSRVKSQRSSSLSELHSARNPLLRLRKSSAEVAITSVNAYASPAIMLDSEDLPPISEQSAALVESPTRGHHFKMMWDETPDHSDSSSEPRSGSPSMTGKGSETIKDEFATWSWSGEQDELHVCDKDLRLWKTRDEPWEGPFHAESKVTCGVEDTPTSPETIKASQMASPGHSIMHFSSIRLPPCNPRVASLLFTGPSEEAHKRRANESWSEKPQYLKACSTGNISRQPSTLAEEETFLKTHRDSVDLAHERLNADRQDKPNPQLLTTRDSMIISKQRLDRYPNTHVLDNRTGLVNVAALSPILDACPPDVHSPHATISQQKRRSVRLRASTETDKTAEISGHIRSDEGCPIYEVERPRNHRQEMAERDEQ